MRLVIRVDDLGWTSDGVEPAPLKQPDAGLELAQRFHDAMQGAPYLGAVIPACVDDDGRAWLASKPAGLTVALHGWAHTRTDGVDSEYRGLSVDDCRRLLDLGCDMIGDTAHLVPPFNACEPTLVEACPHEGIRYVWAGGSHDTLRPSFWATPPQPYPLGRITFVPSWGPLYGATRWRMNSEGIPLLVVLDRLTAVGMPGQAVLTLHLPWEHSKSPTFDGVRELVDRYGNLIVSPEDYLQGLAA